MTNGDKLFATRDYFQFFGRTARDHGSPLYARLAAAAAEDDELLAIAARARPGQPSANLLFAAVHYHVLAGAVHPLTAYYPSAGGARTPDDAAAGKFRDFCLERADSIGSLVARGVTNTNEVLRCAALAPAFSFVHAEAKAPLALVELGPSAGLNLLFDAYAYRLREPGGAIIQERWGPSPVVIDSEARSAPPPTPTAPPPVAARIGLELNPVDIRDPHDRAWLRALIWPDRVDRLARLDSALALAQTCPPLDIRAGDASHLLPQALDQLPQNAAPLIFHSAFLYQLDGPSKARIEAALLAASARRPLWRIALDWTGIEGMTPVVLTRYVKGEAHASHLAESNDHGLFLRWLA